MLNIIQKPSPNFGSRGTYKPELFSIHIMAGTLNGTDAWFAIPASKVSSHFGVGKLGQVHQYVPVQQSAWTNGIVNQPNFKLYKPNVNPNNYTITIECEGYDLKDAPETQLKAISELLIQLGKEYGIPLDRDHIIGHYQIDLKRKPNCPATDKSVLDYIVEMCKDEMVNLQVPKSRLEKITKFLASI